MTDRSVADLQKEWVAEVLRKWGMEANDARIVANYVVASLYAVKDKERWERIVKAERTHRKRVAAPHQEESEESSYED